MQLRCVLTVSMMLVAAGLTAGPAYAGLLGTGRTVQAFYYNSLFANPEGEIAVGSSNTDPVSLATAVDYQQGAADGSTIHIGDTQITIHNLLSAQPFCFSNTSGTACADQIDGFDFKFTGEAITGISVDPVSAAGFLPVVGTFQNQTHGGLQLLNANEIRVDVTGDLPNVNDNLILDVLFATGPTNAPEPTTLALLGLAVPCLLAARRRRRH